MNLQEYLVKLGFNVDQTQLTRFTAATEKAAGMVTEVGAAAWTASTALQVMVSNMARQYERLYYISQRSGQSVRYIQATGYAFSQIGMSADEAAQSIESFGTVMRTQPWMRHIMGMSGANIQQVVGNLKARGMPYFVAQMFGQMMGIPEHTFFEQWKFGRQEAQQRKEFQTRQAQAGIDPEKWADRISAPREGSFIWSLNKLESDLEIFGQRMSYDFINPVQKGIESMDKMVQWLNRADAATGGWLGKIEGVASAFGGMWVVEKLLKRFLGIGGATTMTGEAAGALGGGAMMRGAGGVLGSIFGGAAGYLTGPLGWLLGMTAPAGESDQAEAARRGEALPENSMPNSFQGGHGFVIPNKGRHRRSSRMAQMRAGVDGRVQQALQFFISKGFSPAAARGIVASLYYESDETLSPTAFTGTGGGKGALGIGQWRAERQSKFKQLFGKDLSQASLDEQLQYVHWEMTQGPDAGARQANAALRQPGINEGQAAGSFINLFERPGPVGGPKEIAKATTFAEELSSLAAQQNGGVGGPGGVTLNQKTDIHVAGGPSALDTAKAVMGAQDSVNANLVRSAGTIR